MKGERMLFDRAKALFDNRYDAGRKLAVELEQYKGQSTVVLAIPNGGVPMGLEIAEALDANLDLLVVRKIPLPLSPEAGFGAVADDGTIILNEELVKKAGLTQQQIDAQVDQVRAKIRQRSLLYRKDRPLSLVLGKTVIITDDGLASGSTMMAAVESARRRRPREIIIAVPVSSAIALEQMEKAGNKVVTLAVGTMPRFYVADFYRSWHDLNDDEVIKCLEEWRIQHSRRNFNLHPTRY